MKANFSYIKVYVRSYALSHFHVQNTRGGLLRLVFHMLVIMQKVLE